MKIRRQREPWPSLVSLPGDMTLNPTVMYRQKYSQANKAEKNKINYFVAQILKDV